MFKSVMSAMVLAAAAMPSAASAVKVQWDLSGRFDDDSGEFSGYFVYDDVLEAVTSWKVTTNKGESGPGAVYDSSVAGNTASVEGRYSVVLNGMTTLRPPYSESYPASFVIGSIDLSAPKGEYFSQEPEIRESGRRISTISFVMPIVLEEPETPGGGTPGSGGPVAGAVPEPASWAMMILGFGLVGAAARRRRVGTVHA